MAIKQKIKQMRRAAKILEKASADPQLRDEYQRLHDEHVYSVMAALDEKAMIDYRVDERIAQKLKADGHSIDEIAEIIDLPVGEVQLIFENAQRQ